MRDVPKVDGIDVLLAVSLLVYLSPWDKPYEVLLVFPRGRILHVLSHADGVVSRDDHQSLRSFLVAVLVGVRQPVLYLLHRLVEAIAVDEGHVDYVVIGKFQVGIDAFGYSGNHELVPFTAAVRSALHVSRGVLLAEIEQRLDGRF